MMPRFPRCRLTLIATVMTLSCGCSHINWDRIGNAAERAARHPASWGTAGAAAIFAVDGNRYDKKLSTWAQSHTPVFGSKQKALNASDKLRQSADSAAMLSALLVPTQEKGGEWLWDKSKTLMLHAVSASLTLTSTGVLKEVTDRERPNISKVNDSFPSAHSSTAFNNAALGNLHVQQFNVPPWSKNLLSAGFYSLGGGTAWARVEGGAHYPSDVLFGAALGNFFAIFIYDGFIRKSPGMTTTALPISLIQTGDGLQLQFAMRY